MLEKMQRLKVRAIKTVLTLEQNVFANSNDLNQKIMYGASLPNFFHMDVQLSRMSAFMGTEAIAIVYGMSLDDCRSATRFNPTWNAYSNQLEIYAGYLPDDEYSNKKLEDIYTIMDNSLPLVFEGRISVAYADFNRPERPFIVHAGAFGVSAYLTIETTSIQNQTTFDVILKNIFAKNNNDKNKIGYIDPSGVSVTNGVYKGSFLDQINALCHDYNMTYDVIFNSNDRTQVFNFHRVGYSIFRNDTPKSIISSDTGMIGYPVAINRGLTVKEFFNPHRNVGDPVTLESYYSEYNMDYYVWQIISHITTSEMDWDNTLTLATAQNFAGEL